MESPEVSVRRSFCYLRRELRSIHKDAGGYVDREQEGDRVERNTNTL